MQTVNPFSGQPEGIFFTAACLNVNTDDNPANAPRGLKLNHTFAVQGQFDLDLGLAPAGAESCGIRLADFDNSQAV